jgi:hypothetical protein
MSNIRTMKIQISNPQMHILEEAIKLIAEQYGLEITTQISDYVGHTVKVPIALKGKGLERGIGFDIAFGSINVIGDSYKQQLYSEVANSITQYYIAAQHTIALTQLGYRCLVTREQDKVVVTAVEV